MELKGILKVVLLSLAYGIVIEILQETTTTTRHADIFDVMANLTGATTAFVVFVVYKKTMHHKI
jgi:VanZ family protein